MSGPKFPTSPAEPARTEPVWAPAPSWSPVSPPGVLPNIPARVGFGPSDPAPPPDASRARSRSRWRRWVGLGAAAAVGSAATLGALWWADRSDDEASPTAAATSDSSIELRGHRGMLTGTEFSPDGALVLTIGADGRMIVWDAASGDEITRFERPGSSITSAAFDRASAHVAVVIDASLVQVDADSGITNRSIRTDLDVDDAVYTVDDDLVAIGTERYEYDAGGFGRWHAGTGDVVRTGDGGYVEAVSPDGAVVTMSRFDNSGSTATVVIDTVTGGEVELEGLLEFVYYADASAFSDDGAYVARIVSEYDDEFQAITGVWDTIDGSLVAAIEDVDFDHLSVGFNHSASTLAIVSYGASLQTSTITLYDVHGGDRQRVVTSQAVGGYAFSPDDTQIAVATADGTVTVYAVETGRTLERLTGHVGTVSALAFSPDGSRLVTASDDGTARIWTLAGN